MFLLIRLWSSGELPGGGVIHLHGLIWKFGGWKCDWSIGVSHGLLSSSRLSQASPHGVYCVELCSFRIYVHLEPQNITLFGNRIFADTIKMRL